MRLACRHSLALFTRLQQYAGRLAQAARHPVSLAQANFIGSLPPISSRGEGRLSQAQVEAFAGLYYYAELENAHLLSVAELLVEERYSLNLNDRVLFQALEGMADAMDRSWYDGQRRAQLFSATLGFETNNDIRMTLANLSAELLRFEQEMRLSSFDAASSIEFAMAALLDEIRRRGSLGLERAANQLNGQLRQAITIMGNSTLQRMFNARDLWSLVAAIVSDSTDAVMMFNQAASRAQAGAALIGWVAAHINEIRDNNGVIAPLLQNDASVFRYAAQWQQGAERLSLSGGGQTVGGWPSSPVPTPGYTGGWA